MPAVVRFGFDRLSRSAALVVALAGLALAGRVLLRATASPDAVLLVEFADSAGNVQSGQIDLTREGWDGSRPILPRTSTFAFPRLKSVEWPRLSPDGRTWALSAVTGDFGEVDVYLEDGAAAPRRLTFAPGDDNVNSWSPDGRYLAMSTRRWDPSWYDIGIVDSRTGRVSQVTGDPDHDESPLFSPDGSRLAFLRQLKRGRFEVPSVTCWIAPAGRMPHCYAPSGFGQSRPVGWRDPATLIIAARDSSNVTELVTLDLRNGAVQPLHRGHVAFASASPDGRWLLVQAQLDEAQPPAWFVMPTDRPGEARPIALSTDSSAHLVVAAWRSWRRDERIVGAAIEAPDTIPLESTHRLVLKAYDVTGREVPEAAAVWDTRDSSVAVVDPESGDLRPRRLGSTWVLVTVGVDVRDSVRVTIGPATHRIVLREEWTNPPRAWRFFGAPTPVVTEGPNHVRAMWSRGDASFTSGAYTREEFGAARGLGADLSVSVPLTGGPAQYLSIEFTARYARAALERWDHVTGAPQASAPDAPNTCDLGYPSTDASERTDLADWGSGGFVRWVQVPLGFGSGQWHRLRLQIFPDGRCGLAVDGLPLRLMGSRVNVHRLYRLFAHSYSERTHILVGPVELWEGVRNDVDWSALDSASTRPSRR